MSGTEPRVILVGAGPGAPDLVTVRGMEALRSCDVLVYDNLMADELVALSGASEKIYVGKASGRHMLTQREIGRILVDKASQGLKVVRLKGGDPFVFGRGGEECQALGQAGIAYEVVPGVTAGVAGPAYAGIPVTHRELSRGVTLLTGHFKAGETVDLPWEALARLDHTLVFYMAVAALGEVCASLVTAGLDAATPAAVIEQATMGSQRVVTGTVEHMPGIALERGVRPPALLVVGKVVGLHEELAWIAPRPLAGKMVLFARAAERDYEAVARMRSMGAKVVDVPVVAVVARTGDPRIARALGDLRSAGAVAFTSEAAVLLFMDALASAGLDARALGGIVVAAATRTVERALRARGIVPDVDAAASRQAGLATALAARFSGKRVRVLLPRSSAAGEDLPARLRTAGLEPATLALYDTRPADLRWLGVKLADGLPDAVAFLSASSVDAVLDAVPVLAQGEPQPLWACVGRLAAAALQGRGLVPRVVPETPDVDSMLDLLVEKMIGPT